MSDLIIGHYIIDSPIVDILYQIKRELKNGKLRDIIEKSGDDDVVVTCPSHSDGHENNPSCGVYKGHDENIQYGSYNCFACGSRGPLWHFVAECFDEDDNFGKEWLVERFGKYCEDKSIQLEEINLNEEKKKVLDENKLNEFSSYHPYMTKRKLTQEICEMFKVKYDSKSESLVFPVWDSRGVLVMFTRRSVNNKTFIIDKDIKKPLYLLNKVRELKKKSCIITEGQIDALTCWVYGFPAVATMGSISDYQIDELNNSGVRCVVAMFDNDDSGKKFEETLKKKLRKDIMLINAKIPENKKDVNDMTKEEFISSLREIGIEI